MAGLKDHVIIAGYGRVGRAVAQRLTAAGIAWVALDLDPHRVTQARRQGLQVHFGDADRPEILEAFAVEQARAVVVAVDNPKVALQLTALLHYVLPQIPILARAYDEAHAAELERAGAAHVIPEPAPIGAKIAELILKEPAAEDRAE
jgi:CPA2 family monovalent cation:H+ antiporter-2